MLTKEEEIWAALQRGNITLYYQPLYALADQRLVGAEALARWLVIGGVLPPAAFLSTVEQNPRLLEAFCIHVFRQACEQAARWQDQCLVSVNVSAHTFSQPWFVSTFGAIARSFDLKQIYIELTETVEVEPGLSPAKILTELTEEDIHVVLDDFGKGLSGLKRLAELPGVVRLKIDKEFTWKIGDRRYETIIESTVKLAHELGMTVTAEGVETSTQLDFLRAIECDFVQGFLFRRPLPAHVFEELLHPSF